MSDSNEHDGAPSGRDPFDVLIDAVPRHLWVSLSALVLLLLIGQLWFRGPGSHDPAIAAEDGFTVVQARVVALRDEQPAEGSVATGGLQRVIVEITGGLLNGEQVELDYGDRLLNVEGNRLKVGDRVLVERSSGGPNQVSFQVSDFVRTPALVGLTLLFGALTLVIGMGTGFRSLASVALTVLALAGYFIPGIISGRDALLVALSGSFLLMASSLYLIYQWTPKTHAAFAGVTVSLVLAAVLTVLFGKVSHLTGLGTEEAVMLLTLSSVQLDPRGLLWAGIVIGAVGVLDDVAVSQASAVCELRKANPALGWRELYRRSMVIGRDHIASMVNTLLLAYAGASLPLFLLLTSQDLSLTQTLNREFMAEEIVRTLVGSVTLLLAVPITTVIASLTVGPRRVEANVNFPGS